MTISIGTVVLDAFEVPQRVSYGGRQRLVTHYLADGRRLIDVLGPEELDIRFKGSATGPSAMDRVRHLDRMRSHGEQTVLRWSGLRFPVIVRELALEYRSESWIDYDLTCVVLDPGAEAATSNLRSAGDEVVRRIDELAPTLDDADRSLIIRLRTSIAQADWPATREMMRTITQQIDALESALTDEDDGTAKYSRTAVMAKLAALATIQNAARALLGSQAGGGSP